METKSLIVGVLIGVCICLGAMIVLGQGVETAHAQPRPAILKEVRARCFVVVDKSGKVQAEFGTFVGGDGSPIMGLRVQDPQNGTIELGIPQKATNGRRTPMVMIRRPRGVDGFTYIVPGEVTAFLPLKVDAMVSLRSAAGGRPGARRVPPRLPPKPAPKGLVIQGLTPTTVQMPCSSCGGSGTSRIACPHCHAGIITSMGGYSRTRCGICDGTGFNKCKICGGTGKVLGRVLLPRAD